MEKGSMALVSLMEKSEFERDDLINLIKSLDTETPLSLN